MYFQVIYCSIVTFVNYYLSSKAEFFVSTGGGKSELARLFKKPILRVDHEYDVIVLYELIILN